MRPSFALAAALVALALSLVSVVTAITGEVEVGVVAQDPGGVVVDVHPYGAGWFAGIRPGQRVVSLTPATDPGGWAIETADDQSQHRVSSLGANAPLRVTTIGGILACLLALFAIRDSGLRRRRSELSASLAAVLAAAPFVVYDQPITANLSLVAAGVAPALWLARWQASRRSVGVAMVGSALAVSLGWGVVRTQEVVAARPLGDAWLFAAVAGTTTMLALGAGVTRARVIHAVAALRVLDAAVLVAAVLIGVAANGASVSPLWATALGLLSAVAYARSRKAIRASLDRILLAELRERAAIRATEAERARMAREIHDDPLQAIAGVIQQLEEPAPDTSSARESLRDVAARLRGVATELHPPILDDLGLVPAIEALARAAGDSPPVDVRIEDRTGYAHRPPADVELALYRIVQEAISNAYKHAHATKIAVGGTVAETAVELMIHDDGVGFQSAAAETALRQGHLGASSMKQRAAAIAAAFEFVKPAGGGTVVSVRWPA